MPKAVSVQPAVVSRPLASHLCARAVALTISLFGYFFLVLAGFIAYYADWLWVDNTVRLISSLAVFDRFLIDFFLVLFVCLLLVNHGWFARLLVYVICSVFFVAYTLQFFSVYISGEFVTILAGFCRKVSLGFSITLNLSYVCQNSSTEKAANNRILADG